MSSENVHSDVPLQVEEEAKRLAHSKYLKMLLFREEAAMGWGESSIRKASRQGEHDLDCSAIMSQSKITWLMPIRSASEAKHST